MQRELGGCRKLLASNNIEFEGMACVQADAIVSDKYMNDNYEQEITELKMEVQTRDKKIGQMQTANEGLQD